MVDAEKNLRKCLDKALDDLGYKNREVEIKPVDSDASNFTTVLFEVTVTSPNNETLHLFAKAANLGEKLRKTLNGELLYSTEYNVYTKLFKALENIYDRNNVNPSDRMLFPKFYGGSLEAGAEVIILENLAKTKFHLFDRKKSVDWEHAAVSVKDLATFHALGFALKKEHPDVYAEFNKPELMVEAMQTMQSSFERSLKLVMEQIPEEFKPRVGAFIQSLTDYQETFTPLFLKGSKSGVTTLIHGDFRTSNIMYKRQQGKLVSMLLDYQAVRAGGVFQDIYYMIAVNTDEKFRKYHWDQLVEYYYTELGKCLNALHLDVAEEYPRASFDEDQKAMLCVVVLMSLLILQVVTMDTTEAPDVSSADADFESFSVPPSALYHSRLTGILRDMTRMAVI